MKIAVSVDSSSDIPEEIKKGHNIFTIRYPVTLGDRVGLDGVDVTPRQIFDFVDKTGVLPKTSAINSFEYEKHFEKILKDYDAVIHISISSKISSSTNNATLASEKFNNVRIVDSKNLTMGEGYLALLAIDKIKEGKDLSQIMEELNEAVSRMRVAFIICNLKYLHKGGRCSGIAAFGANLLKIKPRVSLTKGKMEVGKKYRGKFGDVLLEFIDDLFKESNPDLSSISIIYSSADKDIVEKVKDKVEKFGFKEVIETNAGATICCHCGPDTLGFAYIEREN